MLTGYIKKKLTEELGKYVKDFGSLDIGYWSGEVVLDDLELLPAVVEALGLPVKLLRGHIGKLKIKIPWDKLKSAAVEVTIDNLAVIIGPDVEPPSPAVIAERTATEKKARIAAYEAQRLSNEPGDDEKPGFTQSFFSKVFDNVKIIVNDLHIRYEDSVSKPSSPFVFGITLHELSAISTNARWEPQFLADQDFVHKLMQVKLLSVYFAPMLDGSPVADLGVKEFLSAMRAMIVPSVPLPDVQTIVPAFSLIAKAILFKQKKRGFKMDTPELSVHLHIDQPRVDIRRTAYVSVISSARQLQQAEALSRLTHRHLRPVDQPILKGHARAWWRYAIEAVLDPIRKRMLGYKWEALSRRRTLRKKYIDLVKRTRGMAWLKALNKSEKSEMEALERVISAGDIVFFRSIADAELKKEAVQRKAVDDFNAKKKGGGWFSSWFSSSKQDNATFTDIHESDPSTASLSTDDLKELAELIDYDENAIVSEYPKGYVRFKVMTTIQNISAVASDDQGILAHTASLVQTQVNLAIATDGLSVSGSVHDIVAKDTAIPESLPYATILRRSNQEDTSALLQFSLSTEPSVTKVACVLRSTEFVWNKGSAARLIAGLSVGDTKKQFASAIDSLVEWQEYTSALLGETLNDSSKLSVNIDLSAPTVILPRDIMNPDSECLVLNLGQLTVVDTAEGNLDWTGATSLPQSLSVEGGIYTSYDAHLTQVALYLGTGRGVVVNTNSDSELVQEFTMDMRIQRRVQPTHPEKPPFRLFAHSPGVMVPISGQKYHSFFRIIQGGLSATAEGEALSHGAVPGTTPSAPASGTGTPRPLTHQGSSWGEDEFVDASDHMIGTAKAGEIDVVIDEDRLIRDREVDVALLAKRRSLEVYFVFNEAAVCFQCDHNADAANRPGETFLDVRGEKLYISWIQYPWDFDMDLRLSDVVMTDSFETNPELRLLGTSGTRSQDIKLEFEDGQNGSTPRDSLVLDVKYHGSDPKSPLHTGVNNIITYNLSSFMLRVNREVLVRSIKFYQDVWPPPPGYYTLWPMPDETDAGLVHAPEDAREKGIHTMLSREKADVVDWIYEFNIGHVSLLLHNQGKSLVSMSVADLRSEWTMYHVTSQLKTTLGSFSMVDESYARGLYPSLCDLSSPDSEHRALTVVYSVYSPIHPDYPGYDSNLEIDVAPMKAVFLKRILRELYVYFAKGEVMSAFTNTTSEAIRTAAQQLADSLSKSAKKHSYKFTLAPSLITAPVSSHSRRCFEVSWDQPLTLQNHHDLVNDQLHEIIDLALPNLTAVCRGTSDDDDKPLSPPMLSPLNITLTVDRNMVTGVLAGSCTIPLVRCELVDHYYVTLLTFASKNLLEEAVVMDAVTARSALKTNSASGAKPLPSVQDATSTIASEDSVAVAKREAQAASAVNGGDPITMDFTLKIGEISTKVYTSSTVDGLPIPLISTEKTDIGVMYKAHESGAAVVSVELAKACVRDSRSVADGTFKHLIDFDAQKTASSFAFKVHILPNGDIIGEAFLRGFRAYLIPDLVSETSQFFVGHLVSEVRAARESRRVLENQALLATNQSGPSPTAAATSQGASEGQGGAAPSQRTYKFHLQISDPQIFVFEHFKAQHPLALVITMECEIDLTREDRDPVVHEKAMIIFDSLEVYAQHPSSPDDNKTAILYPVHWVAQCSRQTTENAFEQSATKLEFAPIELVFSSYLLRLVSDAWAFALPARDALGLITAAEAESAEEGGGETATLPPGSDPESFDYLCTLPERDVVSDTGTMGKCGYLGYKCENQVEEAYAQGLYQPQSISLNPGSLSGATATYSIPPDYYRLEGEVGLTDHLEGALDAPVVFKIYSLGELLWQSSPFQRADHVDKFSINIVDVKEITLMTESHIGKPGPCHALWINPRIVRLSSSLERMKHLARLQMTSAVNEGEPTHNVLPLIGETRVDRVPYPDSLRLKPVAGVPAAMSFDIGGQYDRVRFDVAIPDEVTQQHAPVEFSVIDETSSDVLWTSPVISHRRKKISALIDVNGASRLQFRARAVLPPELDPTVGNRLINGVIVSVLEPVLLNFNQASPQVSTGEYLNSLNDDTLARMLNLSGHTPDVENPTRADLISGCLSLHTPELNAVLFKYDVPTRNLRTRRQVLGEIVQVALTKCIREDEGEQDESTMFEIQRRRRASNAVAGTRRTVSRQLSVRFLNQPPKPVVAITVINVNVAQNVPMLDVKLDTLKVDCKQHFTDQQVAESAKLERISQQSMYEIGVTAVAAVDFFDFETLKWEPVVMPYMCTLKAGSEGNPPLSNVYFDAPEMLSLNVTPPLISTLSANYHLYTSVSQDQDNEPLASPYTIRNLTGRSLSYWCQEDESTVQELTNGSTAALIFTTSRLARLVSQERHTVSLLVDGCSPIERIAMDDIGGKLHKVRYLEGKEEWEVYCHVGFANGRTMLTVRSKFEIENCTEVDLKFGVCCVTCSSEEDLAVSLVPAGAVGSIPVEFAHRQDLLIAVQPARSDAWQWSSQMPPLYNLMPARPAPLTCPSETQPPLTTTLNTFSFPSIAEISHRLFIAAPVTIRNLLPVTLELTLSTNQADLGLLRPGAVLPLTDATHIGDFPLLFEHASNTARTSIPELVFKISELPSHAVTPVSLDAKRKSTPLYITNAAGDVASQAMMQFDLLPNGSQQFTLFCTHWLVNNTPYHLTFRQTGLVRKGDEWALPAADHHTDDSHSSVSDGPRRTMPVMFVPESLSPFKSALQLAVPGKDYSSPFSLDNVGVEQHVVLWSGPKKSVSPADGLSVGVHQYLAEGRFSSTRVIEIAPRFVMFNNTPLPLSVVCDGDQSRQAPLPPSSESLSSAGHILHWPAIRLSVLTDGSAAAEDETVLSGRFAIDTPSTFVVKLWRTVAPGQQAQVFVRVTVTQKDATFYTTLAQVRQAELPFAIENDTANPFVIWQEGTDMAYQVLPHNSLPYTYDDHVGIKRVWLSFDGQVFDKPFNLAKLRVQHPVVLPDGQKLYTYARINDEGKRVFCVTQSKLRVIRDADPLDDHVESDTGFALEREPDVPTFNILASATGVSLTLYGSGDDGRPGVGIIRLSAGHALDRNSADAKCEFTAYGSKYGVKYQFKVGSFQIDNLLTSSTYPVILAEEKVAKKADDRKPFLHLFVVKSNHNAAVTYVPYCGILIQSMTLKCDTNLILALSNYASQVGDIARGRGPQLHVSHSGDDSSDDECDVSYGCQFSPNLTPPLVDTSPRLMYCRTLILNPVCVYITFTSQLSSAMNEDSSKLISTVDLVSHIFGNVDDARIKLSAFVVEHMFAPSNEFVTAVTFAYKAQVVKELMTRGALGIIAASDSLGNPAGLLRSLGTGVKDFFVEPAQGIMIGPKEFGIGVGKGTSSLVKRTVHGTFQSAGRLLGSASRLVANASLDQEYIEKQQRRNKSQPKNVLVGTAEGVKGFGKSLFDGVVGIVEKPVTGAKQGGVGGFFKGVARGVAGVVTKPVVGAIDMGRSIGVGVGNTLHRQQERTHVESADQVAAGHHINKREFVVYENQRKFPFIGFGRKRLPTDRAEWSSEDGRQKITREECRLPDSNWTWDGAWEVEKGDHTDPDGWTYAVDFPLTFHKKKIIGRVVRRRKWVRVCSWNK